MAFPYTGSFLADAGIAFVFFLFGVWLGLKQQNWLGWVVVAAAVFWVYKLVSLRYNL